jgi:formate dehydrogenase subunit delta
MTAVDESVLRMVNQIAANFAYLSPGEAAAATADHVIKFWTTSMRQALAEHVASGGAGLTAVALEAAGLL